MRGCCHAHCNAVVALVATLLVPDMPLADSEHRTGKLGLLSCALPSIDGLTLPTPSAMVDTVSLRDEFTQRDVYAPSVARVQLSSGSS